LSETQNGFSVLSRIVYVNDNARRAKLCDFFSGFCASEAIFCQEVVDKSQVG
jgi:hypothetical protein